MDRDHAEARIDVHGLRAVGAYGKVVVSDPTFGLLEREAIVSRRGGLRSLMFQDMANDCVFGGDRVEFVAVKIRVEE